MKIKEIKLGEIRDHRPKLVEIHCDNGDYTLMSIPQLMKLLECWIIGEEEVYAPSDKCLGRLMILNKIGEVFNNTPVPERRKDE